MTDPAFRSLAKLQSSAATTRTLDLHSLHERLSDSEEWWERPLFDNRKLNRAFILKHRLRRNEVGQVGRKRGVATKVILPLDPTNLRIGGQYFYVRQIGYDVMLRTVLGGASGVTPRDVHVLETLDRLPGFDPFLIRERLREEGLEASPCYFQVSEPDTRRMLAFVQSELTPLVRSSFAGQTEVDHYTAILASKLLSSAVDEQLEPLRLTLRLEPDNFAEGVFCWRSFLYYKWSLAKVTDECTRVLGEIQSAQPRGVLDRGARSDMARTGEAITAAIAACVNRTRKALQAYDHAYQQLTEGGLPGPFRTFLLEAPGRFAGLGAPLGVVSDITSFWRYRFPEGGAPNVSGEDLREILLDFEASLENESPGGRRRTDERPRLGGVRPAERLRDLDAIAPPTAIESAVLL